MQHLDAYQREMKEIARQASAGNSKIKGSVIAWIMMLIGVAVTGTMTYALTRKGMESNYLWQKWVDVAAALPVLLMEGSAIALVYGKHNWFRSSEQRMIAKIAGWSIWGILGMTSIVHFAFGNTADGTVAAIMAVYASYGLPLVIVAIPMLWKHLYDLAPESQTRLAVLEAEAELKSEMVAIMREQNALTMQAYRDSLDTPEVRRARQQVFEKSAIEHARNIAGFVKDDASPTRPESAPAPELYNGLDRGSLPN